MHFHNFSVCLGCNYAEEYSEPIASTLLLASCCYVCGGGYLVGLDFDVSCTECLHAIVRELILQQISRLAARQT